MQIGSNTTGMQAGLSVATDKEGRDFCVVVVKGTFGIGRGGEATLADEQEPLVYADTHYGDPSATSIRAECDFAHVKPRTDIIVRGHAVSPTGKPCTEVLVTLEVNSLRKHVRVVGDRRWEGDVLPRSSPPVPFLTMPLLFERAFGGSDHSHPNPRHHGTELRNPVGVGFRKNGEGIDGTPLPNLEDPRSPVQSWSDTPPPAGFGFVGRSWQPRIAYAGTYDAEWLENRFPLLPADFDNRYFLSAPADQQVPLLQGGEIVRCTNMTPERALWLAVPKMEVPVLFRFHNRTVPATPSMDTLIIEPDQHRVITVWRTSMPLGRKLTALREIRVGSRSGAQSAPYVER